MPISSQELTERLQGFTQASLQWCVHESETSTGKVSDAITMILDKTARVSQMSKESRDAMLGVQQAITRHFGGGSADSLSVLIQSLEVMTKEYDEMNNLIYPIIQALQFQDKLRQNLENMNKMLAYWLEFRQTAKDGIGQDELKEFGEALFTMTTMKSERDLIRDHIFGLPQEVAPPDVMLF